MQYSEVLERNNRRAVCGIRFRRDTDAGYSSYVEPYTIANSKNEYLAINGNNENLHVGNVFKKVVSTARLTKRLKKCLLSQFKI